MDTSITSLAARQHGAVARRQLVAAMVTPGTIHGLVRRGLLERAAHGVYIVAGSAPTPMREVMIASLRAGPAARVVGERMLAAAGVRDAVPTGPFAVLVAPGRRLIGVDFPWRPSRDRGVFTGAVVDAVPSVDIAGNLVEAASDRRPDDAVRRLADSVRWSGRSRMVGVERLAGRLPDHPGARRLVLLGCLDVDAPESEPERILEIVLAPLRPERQVDVLPGVRLDFLIRSLAVAVEYDGAGHEAAHARRRDAARDDRVRRRRRIETVRVTKRDLRDPPTILARVVAAAAA